MPARSRLSPPSDAARRTLDAAADLFARNGYHGTSIRDLARELGVTVGALYAHFPSKERLLAAVYTEGVRSIEQAVDEAIASSDDPWQRLEGAACAHLEMILEPSSYARVLARVLPSDPPALKGELTQLRDRYEARFRSLFEHLDLAPGQDRRLLRLLMLGALNWSQTWYRADLAGCRSSPRAIARQLVEALKSGTSSKYV